MNIRYGKIARAIDEKEVEVLEIGGVQHATHINPYGLCSKPADNKAHAIIIPILKGSTQDIVLALQDEKELSLEKGDVGLTNGKSSIHLQYSNGNIVIKGANIRIEAKGDFELYAPGKDVKITSGSVTHNGVEIGNKHKHNNIHTHTSNMFGGPTTPPTPPGGTTGEPVSITGSLTGLL